MLGDQTLFTRADEVEEAWRVITPALTAWDAPCNPESVPLYEAGTWQPLKQNFYSTVMADVGDDSNDRLIFL